MPVSKAHAAEWEKNFAELRAFRHTTGHCLVPQTHPLGKWVMSQRRQHHRTGARPGRRATRLTALGFAWDPMRDAWEHAFRALGAYRRREGHCPVPQHFVVADPGGGAGARLTLGEWVHEQRKLRKRGRLAEERCRRLEEAGFVWAGHGASWEKKFRELVCFKSMEGDCNVPFGYSANPSLGQWVQSQRQYYKNRKLLQERLKRLTEIDFVWQLRNIGGANP